MNPITLLRRVSLSCALSLAVASCVTDRQVIAQANDTHRSLAPAVMTDGDMNTYLQSIGERIIGAARQYELERGKKGHGDEPSDWMFSEDMQFHLVNSKTLNAFTTGGEHMYIYSELFDQCRSEDELAAVMSHEYAHVYARHVHKGIQRQYLIVGGSLAAGVAAHELAADENAEEVGAAVGSLALVAGQFLSMGYTRDDEAEADKLGFAFYTRAGWDPAHFGDFFQQLIDKGLDTTPEHLSDHPTLASRVEAAHKRAAGLPPDAAQWRRPPVADLAAYASKKDRVAQLSLKLPSDADLKTAQTLLSAIPSCVLPVDAPEQKAAQSKLARAAEAYGRSTVRK